MVATIQADERIERMLLAMRDAGMTRDQAELLTRAGYVPLEGMLPFHAAAREADKTGGPEWIALGGKRGPGKSHTIMAQVGLDDCQRHEDLKCLFLRKIQKAARESFADLVRKVFLYTNHTPTEDGVKLKNGSRIIIGGFKDERDIDKYLGIEYDVIVIEECTQISETKRNAIRGSLRTSKAGWRPRIYLSTNADGVGLAWFKKDIIEPHRKGKETDSRFFDVTHIHNPWTNPEYEAWLNKLTGPLAKAWRDGNWDAFAGMAFPDWNREQHVIRSFDIPDHWIKWKATDWGYASPFCTLWFTKDPDTRRVYVYRELYQAGLTDQQQARSILDMSPEKEKYFIHYADPSLWERKNRHGKVFSTADEYEDEGIKLTRGDNDRLAGKRKVHNALANLPDGEPGLQIFEDCLHLIDQMGNMASDKNNPEDVDTDQEDHAFDTLKYGLTNERKVERQAEAQRQPAPTNPYRNVRGL
jgi:phage terminase large subunit